MWGKLDGGARRNKARIFRVRRPDQAIGPPAENEGGDRGETVAFFGYCETVRRPPG